MDDWKLPDSDRIEHIRLVPMELLLIDWILCTGSSLLQVPMDELRDEWGGFRKSVWESYFTEHEGLGVMLHLSEVEAKTILTACPTTFTWGDGVDYGLSLKEKLAKMLLGIYIDPALTATVEAEKKQLEQSIMGAADKLRTAESNFKTTAEASQLAVSTLQAKEKEANRLRDDTVKSARDAVKSQKVKLDTAQEALDIAIEEAGLHGICPNKNQTSGQTESPTTTIS